MCAWAVIGVEDLTAWLQRQKTISCAVSIFSIEGFVSSLQHLLTAITHDSTVVQSEEHVWA